MKHVQQIRLNLIRTRSAYFNQHQCCVVGSHCRWKLTRLTHEFLQNVIPLDLIQHLRKWICQISQNVFLSSSNFVGSECFSTKMMWCTMHFPAQNRFWHRCTLADGFIIAMHWCRSSTGVPNMRSLYRNPFAISTACFIAENHNPKVDVYTEFCHF